MDPLCTRENVYRVGLPPEAFARPARPIEGVTPSTGTIALRPHGLLTDDPVTLEVLSSSTLGAPAAAVPGGLAVGTVYYAKPSGSGLFQLAAMAGGAAISPFTDSGSGVWGVYVDEGVILDQDILFATAAIYEHTRAHASPIAADALPFVCAFLAARIYVTTRAAGNPEYAAAIEAPGFLRTIVDRLFEVWLRGVPVAGAIDATPLLAEMGAVSVPLEGRGFLDADNEARA